MSRPVTLTDRFEERRRDEAAFRHLVALTFPVFLAAATARALLAAAGLVRDEGPRQSLVGRARSMAHSVIPYCFMG